MALGVEWHNSFPTKLTKALLSPPKNVTSSIPSIELAPRPLEGASQPWEAILVGLLTWISLEFVDFLGASQATQLQIPPKIAWLDLPIGMMECSDFLSENGLRDGESSPTPAITWIFPKLTRQIIYWSLDSSSCETTPAIAWLKGRFSELWAWSMHVLYIGWCATSRHSCCNWSGGLLPPSGTSGAISARLAVACG